MSNNRLSTIWLAGAALAVASVAHFSFAIDQPRETKDRSPTGQRAPSQEKRREGTRFEGIGRFELSGDRATFFPGEGPDSFRVLENLALERISKVLAEAREPRQWNVVGVFTEYQGNNYLLLTKAVAKLPTSKEPRRPAAEPAAGNTQPTKTGSP